MASNSGLPPHGPSPTRIRSTWSALAAMMTFAPRMYASLLGLPSCLADPIPERYLHSSSGPRTKGAALCNPHPPCSAACPHATSDRRSQGHDAVHPDDGFFDELDGRLPIGLPVHPTTSRLAEITFRGLLSTWHHDRHYGYCAEDYSGGAAGAS